MFRCCGNATYLRNVVLHAKLKKMMFDELHKYETNNHFFFKSDDSLEKVCNAPKNGSGVYLIYALAHGKIELVYIDSSGKMQKSGNLKHRKGGLFDRIVNGKQFDQKRRISWPEKMKKEQIEALDIYWFVTFNNEIKDIPAYTEAILIQKHFDLYETLPRWNEEF